VAGLVLDVAVHLRLAPLYDLVGDAVTQGALFCVEATLAALSTVYLLRKDSRPAWLCACLVALGGTAAVLVTRYLDVPGLGPLPDVHDPQWSPDKLWVTAGMLTTVVAGLVRAALRRRPVNDRAPGRAQCGGPSRSTPRTVSSRRSNAPNATSPHVAPAAW